MFSDSLPKGFTQLFIQSQQQRTCCVGDKQVHQLLISLLVHQPGSSEILISTSPHEAPKSKQNPPQPQISQVLMILGTSLFLLYLNGIPQECHKYQPFSLAMGLTSVREWCQLWQQLVQPQYYKISQDPIWEIVCIYSLVNMFLFHVFYRYDILCKD